MYRHYLGPHLRIRHIISLVWLSCASTPFLRVCLRLTPQTFPTLLPHLRSFPFFPFIYKLETLEPDMEYENDQQTYDGEIPTGPRNPTMHLTRPRADADRSYDRDRSRSPRPEPRDQTDGAAHDGGSNGRDRRVINLQPTIQATDSNRPPGPPPEDEEEAKNTGTNLFVTGIHPRLSEEAVARLFEKYGPVEKCNIMRDPHTRESRGFGFVNMITSDEADNAREALQGEVIEGRTLSIEKARRNRPRTPTPGKYFGPPKRGTYSIDFGLHY